MAKFIHQSWSFEDEYDYYEIIRRIERAGRTCYKSEDMISIDSAEKFIRMIIKRGHESVLEHCNISIRIITDRGVTHEIVRHRLASYSQESTRFCNYGNEDVQFIIPVWLTSISDCNICFRLWKDACIQSESQYKSLLDFNNWSPQQARTVLNNSLKTELVMTCNVREWRHFFKLRANKAAHPQMFDLAQDILSVFIKKFKCMFDDIIHKKEK